MRMPETTVRPADEGAAGGEGEGVGGKWQMDPPLRRMGNSYMYMISTNARYRFETYKEKTNENQASSTWLAAGTTSQSVMKENQSVEER